MINFYYKTIDDIFKFNILPYFDIDHVIFLVENLNNIRYESNGSKMGNWFYEYLIHSSLFSYETMFQKFYDAGFSSYSGFRIKTYKYNSTFFDDVEDWKKRDNSVFVLRREQDEIDIVVCKNENSQQFAKIMQVILIVTKDKIKLTFKKL